MGILANLQLCRRSPSPSLPMGTSSATVTSTPSGPQQVQSTAIVVLPAVVSSLSLPVIANGDVFCYSDFDSIRAAT
ncbi:unnamed protein product, partial [Closterium sp. NIES-54]